MKGPGSRVGVLGVVIGLLLALLPVPALAVASADVSIVKTGPATAAAGTNVTYSITVTNNGPNDAQNVTVSDTLPAGTTLVSFTQNSGPATGGTLAIGLTQTFTLVVNVNLSTPNATVITNTANVSSTTADPDGTNNSSSVSTTINTQADLSIVKTGPATAVAGSNATYSITLTNNGPDTAQSVNVSDTLPAGTTLVTFTQNSGPPTGGPLLSGASMTFTLVVTVNAGTANGTMITNTANVTSTTADPNGANNASSVTTMVTTADVAIVSSGPATVVAGTNATYLITVTNNGPADAQSVTTSDTLPTGTTLVSFTQTSGPPSGGAVPSGMSQTFTLVVHVNANVASGSTITNTANVSSTTPDPNPVNNSSSVTTSVSTAADVSVVKTGPATAVAGANVTYSITVTNNGPSDAQNVNVSDTLPANTTLVSFAQNSGPAVGGTLPAGGVQTFTLVVNVNGSTPSGTVLSNTANVSSTTSDPDGSNNSSTATSTVATVTGLVLAATEANSFSGTVATYNGTCSPGFCGATIDWGDGTATPAVVSGSAGAWDISGNHTYAEEGSFATSVTVTDNGGTSTGSGTANVAEDTLTVVGAGGLSVTEGTVFAGQVASLTDPGSPDGAASFAATIDWGDGSTSLGTITGAGGTYGVSGSHTYADEGTFSITVTADEAAFPASGTASITVTEGDAFTATASAITGTEGSSINVSVGFADALITTPASDLTATIDWGDGSSTAGVITGGSGSFTVTGTHVYTEQGGYTYSVTLADDSPGTASLTAGASASIADAALSGSGNNVTGTAGVALNNVTVGTFVDQQKESPASYTATIDWGDGTTTAGTVTDPPGTLHVVGSHTYASAGSFALVVTLTDIGGPSLSADPTATIGSLPATSAPSRQPLPIVPIGVLALGLAILLGTAVLRRKSAG